METTIETKTTLVNNFMTPEAMLQGLITSLDNSNGYGEEQADCECEEQQINEEIKGLQVESNNIRSEIMEVQNLLQLRDQLYGELDQLRQERDQIENQIETCGSYQRTQIVKTSGYKEMNQRLRRRIYEVRQYIQKMTFENQRIEQGIISNQYLQQQEDILLKRREMQAQYPVYQGKRNTSNVEALIGKIHDKQEQAWRRVRRQQEDIQRRNMDSKMRRTGMRTYYSPNTYHANTRTFYSPTPTRQIY